MEVFSPSAFVTNFIFSTLEMNYSYKILAIYSFFLYSHVSLLVIFASVIFFRSWILLISNLVLLYQNIFYILYSISLIETFISKPSASFFNIINIGNIIGIKLVIIDTKLLWIVRLSLLKFLFLEMINWYQPSFFQMC